MWYSLAANGGNRAGVTYRKELSKSLSKNQLSEAEQMARDWEPGQCPSPDNRLGAPRKKMKLALAIMKTTSPIARAFRFRSLVGAVAIGISGCAGFENEAPSFGKTIGVHERFVRAVVFAPGGGTVFSTDGGNTIRAWDVSSALPVFGGTRLRGGLILAFSPDGKVAVGQSRNFLAVIDLVNVQTSNVIEVGADTVTSFPTYAHLSWDGTEVLLVSFTGNVSLWDLVGGRAIHEFVTTTDRGDASAYSPTGSVFLVASLRRSNIEIRDVPTGMILRTIPAHEEGIRASAFSPDGTYIVSVGIDNSFERWDIKSGELLATYDTSEVAGINRVAFSPNRKLMITGHNDGWMSIWSIQTGDILRRFNAHDGWVEAIAISPDGKGLVSGGPDGKVKYWNLVEILAD